jgi:hypothetical protein
MKLLTYTIIFFSNTLIQLIELLNLKLPDELLKGVRT